VKPSGRVGEVKGDKDNLLLNSVVDFGLIYIFEERSSNYRRYLQVGGLKEMDHPLNQRKQKESVIAEKES